MKKISLTLAAAVVVAVGSAFTTAPKKAEGKFASYKFYRISGEANSQDPDDYVYRPNGGCDSGTGTCAANFTQASAPTTVGEHPTGTFASVNQTGVWNGH